jgi:V/A-type H+/Na+-transporting ATPase subunit E
MDAKGVIDKILADAQGQADKIQSETVKEQSLAQSKLEEQLEAYKKQTEQLAKKAAEEEKSHLLAAARMDIAKENLAEKRGILDEVFSRAQAQLQKLPDEQYLELCTKLMLEAVETGDEEVIIDINETRIDENFISQVNGKLASEGKGNLRLSGEKGSVGGGFILKRGRIKTNVSVDVLLEQARKELEISIAKELFENSN